MAPLLALLAHAGLVRTLLAQATVEKEATEHSKLQNTVKRVQDLGAPGATASYLYPQGRGQPQHFGQSPYSFGQKGCNKSMTPAWTFSHPRGKHAAITSGKALLDDSAIYFTLENSIYKLSLEGEVVWMWELPLYRHTERLIPHHPALYDGLLINCFTDGHVFALDMATGFQVWETAVSHSIRADNGFLAAYNGRVFLDADSTEPPGPFPSKSKLVSLNASTGDLLWEFNVESGLWNFLPHFPGDDTLLYMGWRGDAHRVNMTNGREIWRAGYAANHPGWTDGGPALSSQNVFYTVSSTNMYGQATNSSGGGLHAYAVADGRLLWERTDLEQGIYTYPAVGKLEPNDARLAVVTGVGSLAGVPLSMSFVVLYYYLNGREATLFGLCAWMFQLALRTLVAQLRGTAKPRKRWSGPAIWIGMSLLLSSSRLLYEFSTNFLKFGYGSSIHAFDAENGTTLWRVDLPRWQSFCAAGDERFYLPRVWQGNVRHNCRPVASGYGVIDARGVFWMGHMDGRVWRVKDWNGNGQIDEGTDELCSLDMGSASGSGGVTIVPGMMVVTTCDSVVVFLDENHKPLKREEL